jgi:uncharacterized membrane protein YfcA
MAAGMAAGGVNAIAGSGSLITFPTLLAVGFPAVTANVSNNIGLVPGSISGAYAYRNELEGQAARARRVAIGSSLGSVVGAILLLRLPSDVFDAVVPVLVIGAALLMLFQPRITARVTASRETHSELAAAISCFFAGIYGGYFGAAQGIILLATLGVLLPDQLVRTNALKNVLALTVNAVAASIFLFSGHVDWSVVGLIAFGSVIGARIGATIGKRVSTPVLRAFIVILGLTVGVKLLVT